MIHSINPICSLNSSTNFTIRYSRFTCISTDASYIFFCNNIAIFDNNICNSCILCSAKQTLVCCLWLVDQQAFDDFIVTVVDTTE